MKITKILVLLFLGLSTKYGTAQLKETYEKATLYKKDGTIVKGFIRSEELPNLTKGFCFKKSTLDTKCTTYDTSSGINSFTTNKGKYFSLFKDLKINNNSETTSLFASQLIKSKDGMSLYKSFYNKRAIFILENPQKETFALQKDRLMHGDLQVTRYQFKGILHLAFKGKLKKEIENLSFSEKSIARLIKKHNSILGFETVTVETKEKNIYQWIVNAGTGLGIVSDLTEVYGQAFLRIYYPDINRNISLNLGLAYYHQNKKTTSYNWYGKPLEDELITKMFSIPMQFQYNFFNTKLIRPYAFVGYNFSMVSIKDKSGISQIHNGFQKSYGFNFLFGYGIESNIKNGIYLKIEKRNEAGLHPFLFGLGYIFL
ncbi:outer membrane beta-barrel protein [Ochrovirga pacifica]|uniref:outer membrane beta-barrel protein n=1 Tax=Ochrovirga pacifica TaxID=1042376 RepID=UPI0002558739|nr:outer membrane beta-barrel protein [Ochrovirga pacifica]